MSEQSLAGIALIVVPILFNSGFALLGQRFDYPDVLRRPTHEVLERFRAGGRALIMLWWAFALSAVLFTALAVLLAIAVDDANRTVVVLGAVVGVLASAVQSLGLIRWPFLVPYLARVAREAEPDSAAGQAVDVVFQSFNRHLGVAVGEHLGY
jgi:cytochrome bd-type quinol oxidase subunit 2